MEAIALTFCLGVIAGAALVSVSVRAKAAAKPTRILDDAERDRATDRLRNPDREKWR